MPIYEYECPLCGVFDVIQKASEKPLKAKPECDRSDCPKCAKKIISQSAFHLKGGGWYKSDYGSSSKDSGKKGKSSESTSPASSTSEASTSSSDKSKSTDSSTESVKADSKEPKKDPPKSGGGCKSGCGCH